MSMTESAPTMALQGAGEQMAPTVGANEAAKPDASAGTEATADAAETQPMGSAQVEAEGETEDVDAELEAMKLRLQEMERASMGMKDGAADTTPAAAAADAGAAAGGAGEAAAASAAAATSRSPSATLGAHVAVDAEEAIADADSRSIYVGNVDYSATVEELGAYFADCGTINRVTIMCNKHTGQPKGFAYIEFEDQVAVKNAMILNDSQFRSRQLKVVPKRTNVPGVSRGGYRGRPRFARGSRGIGYGRRARRGLRGRWSPY